MSNIEGVEEVGNYNQLPPKRLLVLVLRLRKHLPGYRLNSVWQRPYFFCGDKVKKIKNFVQRNTQINIMQEMQETFKGY